MCLRVISECRSRTSNAQWNGRKLILTQWRADEPILCRQQKVSAMPHVLYTRDFFRHCCTSKAFAQRTMGTGNHNRSQLNAHVHCIAYWFRYWFGTNDLSLGYWFSSLEYIRRKNLHWLITGNFTNFENNNKGTHASWVMLFVLVISSYFGYFGIANAWP